LFDSINASKLNDHLKNLMDGLSAKVFRTYNASITLQEQLEMIKAKPDDSIDARVKAYNDANRTVALLCNHQKTVSKNFDAQVSKMQDALKQKLDRLKELEDNLKRVKNNREPLEVKDSKTGDLKKLPRSLEQTMRMIEKQEKSIDSEEYKLKQKEDNKQVALSTSKINYMDPRISITWCKNQEVPIEKIFTKQLRSKFSWAMYIEPEFKF